MSSGITLSAATRQNLLSLQDTAAMAATNQNRLATGKKVNSALDNPVNYFTAVGLSDRSSALSGLLDGISNGIQTIQAASKGVDAVTSIVKQMQSVVSQAQSNAATNLPKMQGTVALATQAQADAAGKSIRDTALSKTVLGAAGAGIVGLDSTKADQIKLKAGNTDYTFSIGATDTVNDLVNNINKSGIATATIDNQGQLVVTGTGSDTITMEAGKTAAGVFTADAGELAKLTNGVAFTTSGGTSAQRSALVDQFNTLRTQLDQAAKDAGFNGINLLAGDNLTIAFNEKTGTSQQSKLDVQGNSLSSASLGIGQFKDSNTATGADFAVQNNASLTSASNALKDALTSLKSISSTFGSNLSTVQNRQTFTKEMMNVLDTGAANLVNADMNAEAANSQALTTRQSLGISALSLANQANQGILQLLR
ncbi:flagellin [Methylorubrum populi]|uniref:Flagellin n=1 Tax=Methylorubrum populi TaxID=223967 RepID=A0A833N1W4_9HYPH|nr:flagellin [Methylorubrum populi]KAB7786666.1 Flagellar cap protein FliD [Methylorubrum populi]